MNGHEIQAAMSVVVTKAKRPEAVLLELVLLAFAPHDLTQPKHPNVGA